MNAPTVLTSVNPATGETITQHRVHTEREIDDLLDVTHAAGRSWSATPFADRASVLRTTAERLRAEAAELAALMADEMGKPVSDGEAEAEKCAWVCEFYAEHAEEMLADVERETDLARAWTSHRPLGTVLAVMPWNFPLWQVFRFAAPSLMAGNAGVLKHASNVTGSAIRIEELFSEAGLPDGVFRTLILPSARMEAVVADDRVAAVTLTGSEAAGRAVAKTAGAHLKPSLLELGGSDPYVVLHDADVEEAASVCAESRLTNSGQSCIAAKRFIVVDEVYEEFREAFVDAMAAAVVGDPHDRDTDVGPQARHDLRDDLHDQVRRSVEAGASLLLGGEVPDGPGAYYPPTVLEGVGSASPAFAEEVFGPVAPLIRATDEAHAIALANDTDFGLGGAVFTADVDRGSRIAVEEIRTGNCFVNAKVASDPRLPFGGVGISGYGRELSEHGIHAFVNAKTIAVR